MESPPSSDLPRSALLALAWVLLVAAAAALRPILPIDETRYASVAWEMWVRGDFLVPHLNGLPYSDKPPLLFWLFQFGWWFFGVNDWWPRLVPALFALASLALTERLARRLWPDRPEVAVAAPAVLLGFLLWSVFTTMVMFDMLVTFCVLVALLGLEAVWREGGVRGWLQVGAALGLGILAKGPVVFLVPLLVAVLAPWWGREVPRLRTGLWWLRLLSAVGLAAAIALAWALPAAAAGGPAYADAILIRQTEQRLVYSFAHDHAWWWYLSLLPLLLYPYSFWPPLWRAACRRRHLDSGLRFCLSWLIPGLVAFSLISGKQPHYLLPLMPAFALLAARFMTEPGVTVRRWHLIPALSLLVLFGAALAAAPFLAGRRGLPSWVGQISPGAGAALLALAAASFFLFDRLFARRVSATLAPTLITLALVLGASPRVRGSSPRGLRSGADLTLPERRRKAGAADCVRRRLPRPVPFSRPARTSAAGDSRRVGVGLDPAEPARQGRPGARRHASGRRACRLRTIVSKPRARRLEPKGDSPLAFPGGGLIRCDILLRSG